MHQVQEAALEVVEQPSVEVLPADAPRSAWRHAVWPALGSALVWASRELLPGVLAAWRATNVGIAQPLRGAPSVSRQLAAAARRTGHRHRWGRG